MKKIIFFLLTVVFILALILGIIGLFIQTDGFWKTFLPRQFNKGSAEIKIASVDFVSKSIDWAKGRLLFQDLKLNITTVDGAYDISAQEAVASDLYRIFFRQGFIHSRWNGIFVVTPTASLEECRTEIDFETGRFQVKSFKGAVSCSRMTSAGASLADFTSDIRGTPEWIAFENIDASFQGGIITGKSIHGLNSALSYSMDLSFDHLVFDQALMEGRLLGNISGRLQANGFSQNLDSFEMSLEAPEGVNIRADLLQAIIPYLPARSSVKKDLEKMIKIGDYVFCESGRALFRKDGRRALTIEANLRTKKLNLDLNPTIDIKTDGNLQSLLKMLEFFTNS